MNAELPTKNYAALLTELKQKVRLRRQQASVVVNTQLLYLYWEIGTMILTQQSQEGWGTKVIKRLAADLKAEFPDMKGLSERNLKYMRTFAEAYPQFTIVQTLSAQIDVQAESEFAQTLSAQLESNDQNSIAQAPLAQLTWSHHTALLDKVSEPEERHFYIHKTIENGWSRNVMIHQIESKLHARQGAMQTNFMATIPPNHSELVQQVFKDPYKFEFIHLSEEARERDIENALINHIQKFLVELGQWFAFMGRQYKMKLGENEYFYDLLFYHTKLKRYIVIDLKIDEFKPEYKGKMEFYLKLADDQLKGEGDEPSIGLILCKTKDGLVAEYALRDSNLPIGIAEYEISNILPEALKSQLPTEEELVEEMDKEIEVPESALSKKMQAIKDRIAGLNSEPIKEKQSEAKVKYIIQNFYLAVYDKVEKLTAEIAKEFLTVETTFWMNGTGRTGKDNFDKKVAEATNLEHCSKLELDFRFDGFKKAGLKAFQVSQRMYWQFYDWKYEIYLERGDESMQEKLYHETITEADITHWSELVATKLLQDLENNLNRMEE